jgi:hypothetical protein
MMKAPLAAALARLAVLLLPAAALTADPVPVRYLEGRIHGFLVLRDTADRILASGSLHQSVEGNRVTSELSFRFRDGSLHQETAVYSQSGAFQLLTYRLVQKGATFKRPTDMSLNTATGEVAIRYSDDHGKQQTINERLELPPDLANGMISTLLGDIDPKAAKTTLSMLVSTPKPRLVKLEISPLDEDSFSIAGATQKAMRYNVKVEIGGIAGVVAPIVGKQPPDTQIWMVRGSVPGFLKSVGPMFQDGPVWKIELASPVWPKPNTAPRKK